MTGPALTPLASESTTPSIGDNHPAALAFHNLNTAADILARDYLDEKGFARAKQLLGEGTINVGALHLLFIRQEKAIGELSTENVREKRYSKKVEDANSTLSLRIIELTTQLDEAHAIIRKVRETYTEPRIASAGAMKL